MMKWVDLLGKSKVFEIKFIWEIEGLEEPKHNPMNQQS